jgi:two-component system chemotaxis family response regulator WspR
MMDIDHFKAYNDNYGHQAGDDCLRRLANKLGSLVRRPADLFARYGGEEFVYLLPDTDAEGALWMANRVQEAVKIINISHGYSSVADHVTLSIGVATVVPTDSRMPSDLIDMADTFLYEAKQNGRNQIKQRTDDATG